MPSLRVVVCLLIAVAALTAFTPPAAAATARELYASALGRERALRAPTRPQPPTLAEFRSLIARYRAVVRQYPRSGYSDNALWQAAGLALDAFEHFGEAGDRVTGERVLRLLRSEYPSSSLIGRIDERLQRFARVASARLRPTLVTRIDRTPLAGGVRVTIYLGAEVAYHHERLQNPDRVFFDLPGTEAVPELQNATLSFSDDIVRKIRLGRHPNGTTRVVLDLDNVEDYSVFALYNPYRLVIDTRRGPDSPAPTTRVVERTGPAPPAENSGGAFSLSRQLGLGIARVVIDPGHGGRDPGAQGSGISEADLVLDISLRLKGLLASQPGVDVVLTRETDAFVPLEERTALANRQAADLFLSIHANASRNRSARGIETYFLNFAADPEAEALAARENASSGRTMARLQDLVQTIALNNKLDESRDFAEMVQESLYQRLRPVNPNLRDLGVKQAPFVVLIGAQMPSVLAEISFVSNRAEALLLRQDDYRERIAQALFEAVLRYQRALKNIQVAAQP